VNNGVHVVKERECEDLVGYVVCQLLALVANLVVHPLVFVLNMAEFVGVSATVTAQRGEAVVQSGAFAVESSHFLTVGELDKLWRGQLFAVVSDHHGSHAFSHPCIECQHAVDAVSCLCVFDFHGEGEFVVGVTGFTEVRGESPVLQRGDESDTPYATDIIKQPGIVP